MISTLILCAIILPLLVAALLSVPAVQNFITDKLTASITEKTGMVIDVDRVRIKRYSHIEAEGLFLGDLRNDTLLYAQKVSANLSKAAIAQGRIVVSDVEADNALVKIYMIDKAEVLTNVKEVMLAFGFDPDAPREPSDFEMEINDVRLENSRFVYQDRFMTQSDGGMHYFDMDFKDLSAGSRSIKVIGDSISMELHDINFHDKSGVVADNVSTGDFSLSGSNLYFTDLSVRTGNADLFLPHLALMASDWKEYQDFINKVRVEGVASDSRLDLATLSNFVPVLESDLPLSLSDVNLSVEGLVNDFEGRIRSASINSMASISTRLSAVGLAEMATAELRLDSLELRSEGSALVELYAELTGKQLPAENRRMLSSAGSVVLAGSVSGRLDDLRSNLTLSTSVGDVLADVDVRYPSGDYSGVVDVKNLDMGRLLGKPIFGKLSMSADLAANLARQDTTARLSLRVDELDIKGYTYRDITLEGELDRRLVMADLLWADEDREMISAEARINLNGSEPYYNLRMNIDEVDLHAMNLVKDSVALFSVDVDGLVYGRRLEEIHGEIELRDISYITPTDTLHSVRGVEIEGRGSAGAATLDLRSDFVDMSVSGPVSYREIVEYFGETLWHYLPSLSSSDEHSLLATPSGEETDGMDGVVDVKIDFKQTDDVTGLLLPGLQIAPGTNFDFHFNPTTEHFDLEARSPYIEFGNTLITELDLNGSNLPDSMWVNATASDLYLSNIHLPRVELSGGARQNHLDLVASFRDNANNLAARLGICTLLGRTEEGKPMVTAHLEESYLSDSEFRWDISADSIIYTPQSVVVNRFSMATGDQHLTLDGRISPNKSDTLRLDVQHLDLALLNPLLKNSGYDIAGQIDGYADLVSVLNKMEVAAELDFKGMRANEWEAAPLKFESSIDFGSERITLLLSNAESGKELIRGYYRPADRAYLADVTVGNIPVGLLDPMLKGVASDNRGMLGVDAELSNSGGGLKINGDVNIDNLVTTVDFLGVRYSLPEASLRLRQNVGTLRGARIYDHEGNSGGLELEVDLSDMQNLRYNVRLLPEDMMVLNTSLSRDAQFYGKVYASGAVTVEGDNLGTNMNIVATTSDNSTFNLPLSGSGDFSTADFVTFVTPVEEVVEQDELSSRRQRYQQEVEGTVARKDLNISMTLNVLPNLDFRLLIDPNTDNLLRATGNAALNLNINPGRGLFNMYGDYQITEGTLTINFENLIERQFTIQSGSTIDWSGSPMDATLDIEAFYSLKTSLAPLLNLSDQSPRTNTTVECIVRLSDKLSEPTISFDVRVPNADSEYQNLISSAFSTQEMMATQFIYLLAFGNFYSDTSAQNLNIGAQTGSMIGFDFLSRQISNLLSSEDVSFDFRYRPRGELNSDEVGVDIQKPLIGDKLVLELEASYDTGNNPTSSTETRVSGGGSLTYTIDKAGNLVLRGFSRTIDSFDENQGLQENGVGLYYQRNFNTFKELLEERRAARAARRLNEKGDSPAATTTPSQTESNEEQ